MVSFTCFFFVYTSFRFAQKSAFFFWGGGWGIYRAFCQCRVAETKGAAEVSVLLTWLENVFARNMASKTLRFAQKTDPTVSMHYS